MIRAVLQLELVCKDVARFKSALKRFALDCEDGRHRMVDELAEMVKDIATSAGSTAFDYATLIVQPIKSNIEVNVGTTFGNMYIPLVVSDSAFLLQKDDAATDFEYRSLAPVNYVSWFGKKVTTHLVNGSVREKIYLLELHTNHQLPEGTNL